MNYRCLADFFEDLRDAGELERIDTEVDPCGEAADLARKYTHARGMTLLFSNLRGHDLPVVVNLFGTESRICRALDVKTLDEMSERITKLITLPSKEGILSKLLGSAQTSLLASIAPRTVKSAACQQIVRLGGDVDLFQLPLLRSSPDEKERILPSAPIITVSPDTQQSVTGRFDLQILDRRQLVVCFADHDEPARAWKEFRRRNEKMPLAIVLGGDPAFMLASAAVLPGEIDACSLAGLFREKPLEVAACRSVDLAVPAEVEIVLEGYLDPQTPPVATGPMLSSLGDMTPPRLAPTMQVTAMTQRANPVYPAIVYGRPPHEMSTIARALMRMFLPVMKSAIEELVDFDLPEFGAGRHWAAISIRKSYAAQSQRVAHAAAAMKPFWFAKWLVIVDEAIDVRDTTAVLAAMAAHVNPSRDIWPLSGVCDRIAIDATRK
jgi:4-hydroxy-3-polyprenylbenzoate decarboxylase